MSDYLSEYLSASSAFKATGNYSHADNAYAAAVGCHAAGISTDPIMTIKGTAMNKGRARVWVERSLSAYGLSRGTPITISFESDCIVVTADPAGKRKVAGRPDKEILDICFPVEQRAAMFGGAERLAVYASFGKLVIRSA